MKKIKELYYKYEEIISYLIVGGLTTVVSLATYYLLVYTILNPKEAVELQIANIISWMLRLLLHILLIENMYLRPRIKYLLKRVLISIYLE